jgi:oligopeptide transport system permease protein
VTEAALPVGGPPPLDAGAAAGAPIRQASLWRDAWYRYVRNRGAVLAGAIFLLVVAFAIVTPFASPHDPYDVDFAQKSNGPSWAHPFGTDQFGRDVLTRTALATRISLGIGLSATIVILVVGLIYGSISGFAGGWLDSAMMRSVDLLFGLPYLPFAIITLQIFGTVNFGTMVVALSVVSWLLTARVVRGQIITLKENDYVRAAKAVGARWYRIVGRHLVPNTLGILIIAIFIELPGVILGEAFLSFIGLGIAQPDASLGSMARDGFDAYRVAPHIITVPSVMICVIVMCTYFISDGLRDALDPRTRET